MARKQQKKKVQQYEHNTQRYFGSGRAAKLPLAMQYMTEFESEGVQYLLILITRDHINGNKAFSEFIISRDSGYLDFSHYDYNQPPESVEEFIRVNDLQPIEDYWVLHNTITMAKSISKDRGFRLDPDIDFPLMILEPEDKALTTHSLLDNWSTDDPSGNVKNPNDSNPTEQPLNFRELSPTRQEALLTYNPDEISGWTKTKWDQYLEEAKNLDLYDFLLKGISPLLYIFEKAIVPFDKASDAILLDAADKFSRTQLPLTYTPFSKIGNYNLSQAELDIYTEYFMLINGQSTTTDFKSVAKKIIATIKEYPENPQFYNLLIVCYQITDNYSAIDKTAKKTYHQFPDYLFAKINYIDSLLSRRQYNKIAEILGNTYLLEDIYPERQAFHYSEYKQYYRVLIIYLFDSKQFAAGWAFYKAYVASPFYKEEYLKDVNSALKFHLIGIANFATFWIQSIINVPQLKNEFLAQLNVS